MPMKAFACPALSDKLAPKKLAAAQNILVGEAHCELEAVGHMDT